MVSIIDNDLLSACCVPGDEDTAVNKTDSPALTELTDNKQANKPRECQREAEKPERGEGTWEVREGPEAAFDGRVVNRCVPTTGEAGCVACLGSKHMDERGEGRNP